MPFSAQKMHFFWEKCFFHLELSMLILGKIKLALKSHPAYFKGRWSTFCYVTAASLPYFPLSRLISTSSNLCPAVDHDSAFLMTLRRRLIMDLTAGNTWMMEIWRTLTDDSWETRDHLRLRVIRCQRNFTMFGEGPYSLTAFFLSKAPN